MSDIKVVKVGTHGFYDVFTGMGWRNHIRVRMIKGDVLVLPEGRQMIKETQQIVKVAIKNNHTKFVNRKVGAHVK